ncbi:hypothetical protein TNCV_391371 [Trichonephila clavipes]|nr:hypothetical protein TNCV_391371 [Trichonephila clavipes]
MALDVWKEVYGVESMLILPKWPLLIARSSRSFVFLGRPDPRRYTLPSVILPTPSNYQSLRPRWLRIRPTCFLRPIIKVRQLLVLPPVTS